MTANLCEARDEYVVIQDGLAVFDCWSRGARWMLLRRLKEGDILEAAGEVQDVQGIKMLPIFPTGAVEMRGLDNPSEDIRRPILLNRCLFGSSEDVSASCHVEDSSLLRPAENFVETDDEFSFVAVKHDDFTFRYGTTPPHAGNPCQQACTPRTVESSSDTQSSSTHELEGKAEDEDATPCGAKMFPERLVVRNTFFDIEIDSGEKVETQWKSCPTVIMTKEFRTKYPAMEQAHIQGDCRPCAYFLTKTDGCQHGGECSFCHLCPLGALKIKKKEKVKSLKQRDYRARALSTEIWVTSQMALEACQA